MKQDICSMTLGDKRIFSYFSVALGLMADLDLGKVKHVLCCKASY